MQVKDTILACLVQTGVGFGLRFLLTCARDHVSKKSDIMVHPVNAVCCHSFSLKSSVLPQELSFDSIEASAKRLKSICPFFGGFLFVKPDFRNEFRNEKRETQSVAESKSRGNSKRRVPARWQLKLACSVF